MRTAQLLKRSLGYYWRTNLAVVLGVATAVAVLAGALLVGDSVRASLRDLFVLRLGQTDHVITNSGFFREQLAEDLQNGGSFASRGLSRSCPLIELSGGVSEETSKARASDVRVYGVDERFWEFHGREVSAPENRELLVSESLARELNSKPGDSLLVQIEKPSEVPIESLYGHKEDLGRTLRLTIRETLTAKQLGEFAIRPQQAPVRAVFVPLRLLQRELDQQGKVNMLLVSRSKDTAGLSDVERTAALEDLLKERVELEDYNINLRPLDEERGISLERTSTLVDDKLAQIARATAETLPARTLPVLSYLANRIRSGERSIPYSLVTGLDEESFRNLRGLGKTVGAGLVPARLQLPGQHNVDAPSSPPIILNEWAARDLGIHEGNPVSVEYYLWHEDGRLETKTAQFYLAAIVPLNGLAADKDLVPEYPGITGSESLSEWDPPFPVDLKRVRKQDEDYWHQYRTTPKAFIPLAAAQELWQSRFGKLTSLRILPPLDASLDQTLDIYRQKLKAALDLTAMGFAVIPARAQGLAAARGATDFGEYFLYFSFFLVVSALLLTALFFKLGIEQRLREIGLLQAVGFPAARIRWLFLAEGSMLAIIGSVIGLAGALAYGQLMMFGLRTWWVDAVGTTTLSLHVAPRSLLFGTIGGVVAALACVVWTLRRVGKESTRSLLTGTLAEGEWRRPQEGERLPRLFIFTSMRAAILFSILGLLLLITAALNFVGQVAGFFGSAIFLLTAFLCYQSAWLRRKGKPISGTGWWPVSRLGFRNATYRPGRSVLCIALIASAAFIIVSVDSFRHRDGAVLLERKSGSGGFPLLAESLLPVVYDPNTSEGREFLNLTAENTATQLSGVTFTRFRLRPGDDASCLNLYQPANPKIIAPTEDFLRSNRFAFQDSLASSPEEKENPWLLLHREFSDGAVPVVADANSLTYVLHLKLGDDFVLNREGGPVRLRLVGSLADSILQSELVMAEKNFLRLFPEQEGYRFFLIDTPRPDQSSAIAAVLEDRLSDFGFDVVPTAERLANFHRVENTYLSTFQMLGGLGLLLGTLGMAAVLLRNVIERRRELALLRAVGYNSSHFTLMVVAENALLLFCGLVTGSVCALLAIAPVFFSRHAQLPDVSLGLLLLAVLISGLTASIVATWAALRAPLLPALRAE
jgi:ABC-type lipoprotein release transport system permease subunit